MGVTDTTTNRDNLKDLDNAILLAIRDMLPEYLDVTQIEAREFKPFHDGGKHESLPGLIGLGTNLSDLYCVMFYDEATGRRVLTPSFQKVESTARKLEARLSVLSTDEQVKREMKLFFEQTAMPFEFGNYFYQKIKGDNVNLRSIFDEHEIDNINNLIDLQSIIYITEDYVNCKKTILESYAGHQSFHFFFAQPEKYERIPKQVLNEILLIVTEKIINGGDNINSSLAYLCGNILNNFTELTEEQGDMVSAYKETFETKFGVKIETMKYTYLHNDVLEMIKEETLKYFDFYAYSIACNELKQELDFSLLNGFFDSMYSTENGLTAKGVFQDPIHNTIHVLSSVNYAVSIGYDTTPIIDKLEGIVDNIQDEMNLLDYSPMSSAWSNITRKAALTPLVEIFSKANYEEGLIKCLKASVDLPEIYRDLLSRNSELRINSFESGENSFRQKDNAELISQLEERRAEAIASQDYFSSFLINRVLGFKPEELLLDIIKQFISKNKDESYSFKLNLGEEQFDIEVKNERMIGGYSAKMIKKYSITIGSMQGNRKTVIKENSSAIDSELEAKLSLDAVGNVGKYVVIREVLGAHPIATILKQGMDDKLIDTIIYSFLAESERINSIKLSDRQSTYITVTKFRRLMQYKEYIKTNMGRLGERIVEEMDEFTSSESILVKDMNSGNVLFNSGIRHIDYNYLDWGALDTEFVAFYDSFGKKNEEVARREYFIQRMFEIREMDEEVQQQHYQNAFRHNMGMYVFCMLKAIGVDEKAALTREKVGVYKFEKAIEAYSHIQGRDDILLYAMKRELETLNNL